MKKTFLSIFIILFLIISFSCNKCNKEKNSRTQIDIPKEDTFSVKVHRYEKALFAVDIKGLRNGLKKLTKEYSFFIPDSSLNDSSNLIQMKNYLTDKRIIELYEECVKIFPDEKDLESRLTKAFGYLKHYYPDKKIPKVFTYVSDLYHESPVIYDDSVLIIALDMYLGKDYKYYKMLGQPQYRLNKFNKEYILSDCMREIAITLIDNSKGNKKFIDYIIYEGKVLYFLDAMLPDTPDSIKIGYTSKQMDWCLKNESNIWSFIIDKKLLYTSDPTIIAKLCMDGPFTPVFSKQSPSRTGIWIGWQIVRGFMENNAKVTLSELSVNQDAQDILTRSKYKPKK
jgi:hypothetical protein